MRKALTSFINLLKPYKVPPLFQRMKTDNASEKKKKKTYSTECEAALAKLLTFIWANFSPGLQRASTIPLVHKKPDTASRLRGDPQSWLIFVILFLKNAQ